MHSDGDLKKRVGRKLTKKRRVQRDATVDIPERFKDGDDAQEDAAACGGKDTQYMNQSVFSMIAAAGSKVDFHSRFDDDSSDSDEGSGQPPPAEFGVETQRGREPPQERMEEPQQAVSSKPKSEKHRRKISEYKLLRSLPKLNLRTSKEKNYLSESSHLPSKESNSPSSSNKSATPREAPVMSRMLEAQAEAQFNSTTTTPEQRKDLAAIREDTESDQNPSSLAIRLMEIFGYEKPEGVISGRNFLKYVLDPYLQFSEYPCWLLQSVLLQGYMYITQHHICFYAYLPKRSVGSLHHPYRNRS